MTQINLSMKKETDSQTCDCQDGRVLGNGWNERLGLADVSYYI